MKEHKVKVVYANSLGEVFELAVAEVMSHMDIPDESRASVAQEVRQVILMAIESSRSAYKLGIRHGRSLGAVAGFAGATLVWLLLSLFLG